MVRIGLFRLSSIILAISIITLIHSSFMVFTALDTGINPESGDEIKITEVSGLTLDDGNFTDKEYDIKKENLTSESKVIFNNIHSRTGFTKQNKVLKVDDADEVLTEQLLSEPLICDDCKVSYNVKNGSISGTKTSFGYYKVKINTYKLEPKINIGKIVMWSSIAVLSFVSIILFIIKRKN